ncbi:MAG: type II secretion system protein [Elusimicrobiota bacterium]|jgi:prepilin-type N-terminal cleavage/methylation domain-containing protein
MRASRKLSSGFTLIELMIVVSIIGILAAIAVPKFADLIRKAQEGKTKGSLGAVRSALSIYYSDMEGHFPSSLESLTIAGKYLITVPKVMAAGFHPETSTVYDNTSDGCNMLYTNDKGGLAYWSADKASCPGPGFGGQRERSQGEVWISCVHTDMRGTFWTEY